MNPRLTMSRFRSGSLTTFSAAKTLVCSTCISQRISYTRGACGRAGTGLAVRGESVAWPRDGRGAARARCERAQGGVPTVRLVHGGVQDREYLREEQRSPRGCIARRMQPDFHHGLLAPAQRAPRQEGALPAVSYRHLARAVADFVVIDAEPAQHGEQHVR